LNILTTPEFRKSKNFKGVEEEILHNEPKFVCRC